jgi:AraC family transcriptional regulator of arabinose operon
MPVKRYVHHAPDSDHWGEKVTIVNAKKRYEWFSFPLFMEQHYLLNVMSCGYAVWEAGVSITRTRSRIFALELVTAGDLEFTQGGKSYLVGPGQVFFLRKGMDHSYRTGPAGRVHKRILSMDGGLLDQVLMQTGLANLDVLRLQDAHVFAGFVKQAMRTYEERRPQFMRRLSELAYAVLLYLSDEQKGMHYPPAVQRALDYMYEHLASAVSLPELSQAAATSVPHLCRLFHRHLGEAPVELFRRIRVRHAASLLAGTTARIEEIAFQLGYEDIVHFSHTFSREMGLSPREFRKKQAGEKRVDLKGT